ncbi:MAG TPA: cell division topological specificity factor MinE, partial [Clostridia bacterium]|nr:cell division topological specificity factor MinE [Clostridia bacterium]
AMVLQDRMNLPANYLDMMAYDIANAISCYIDVDFKKVDIKVATRIYDKASVPVLEVVLPIKDFKENVTDMSIAQ